MKKIINQKRYDTETATERGTWSNSFGITDFQWCSETLYQKKTGEFFLYGEGGPMSRYAEPVGNSSWESGERLMPLSYEEARAWAEEKLTADEYESIFGEVTEDGERISVGLSLPKSAAEQLKRLSAQTGRQQSEIVADLLTATPPTRPEAEAMKTAHEKYLAWAESPEGKALLKKSLPPDVYQSLYGE